MDKSIHKHSTKVCALIPVEVLHHHLQVKYLIGLKTNNGYQYSTDPTPYDWGFKSNSIYTEWEASVFYQLHVSFDKADT